MTWYIVSKAIIAKLYILIILLRSLFKTAPHISFSRDILRKRECKIASPQMLYLGLLRIILFRTHYSVCSASFGFAVHHSGLQCTISGR